MNNKLSSRNTSTPQTVKLLQLFCFSALTTALNTAKAEIQTITVTENKASKSGYDAETSSISHNSNPSRLKDIQSVSVVPKTLLDDYQVQSLSEALRFVSGVSQANTLAGTEDGFTRRGFGSNSDGSIYRDGIRSNLGLNVDATTERVEVLKGSASLLYGIQNPGGIINVISKKPQYRQHSQISVRSKSSGGGAGTVDVTGPLGAGFAYRLIAEKQHEDYWRNFGSNQHTLIAPSLQWYGENSNLLLRYTDYQYDIPYDRGTAFINGAPVPGNYRARLDDKANHAWGHTRSFSANYQWQFTDNWRSLFNFGFNQRQYNNNEVRLKSVNVSTGKVTRTADANRGFDHKNQFISWELAGQQSLFNQQHNLNIGVDYEINQTYRAHQYSGKSYSSFNLYQRRYNLLDPITDSSTENTANANKLNRIFSRSLYLKDAISLTDRWVLVLAGRYQHYTQQASQQYDPVKTTFADRGIKFLPQTGVIYFFSPTLSWYSSFSKSFTPATEADDNGNVASPEQGRTIETGLKWQINPRLFASWSVYRIDEKQMALTINGINHPIDLARSTGTELEINGEIATNWQISANYSYDHAIIVKDSLQPENRGNKLQNTPTQAFGIYLSHDLTQNIIPGAIRIGAGSSYIGNRAGSPENNFTLPGYTVTDSFIRWQRKIGVNLWQVRLNANNLFNRHYYPSSGGNLRVAVGETRNLQLEASVDF